MWAEHNSRENLTERGEFGIHTTYVCGTLQIDAAKNKINMAYSTENLLLNEYRQGQHGMPSIVHVDCTHRVVVDGHVCMLFGTVDTAQHFHVIGYGICDKEDQNAHEHIFRCLKTEVETIVKQRIADQQLI